MTDQNKSTEDMRAVTFVLTPTDDSHPVYRMFESKPEVNKERIYHLNVLEDETMVLVGRISGDIVSAEQLISRADHILDFSISGDSDGGGLVYIHSNPPPAIKRFLQLPGAHGVFFDFPLEGTTDGHFRVTMIGETNEVLQNALADVPPELEVEVERIGPPPMERGGLNRILTRRQSQILEVALELGYYDVPRNATHQDVADQMDLSVGTVGEHLQKIEARVIGSFTD